MKITLQHGVFGSVRYGMLCCVIFMAVHRAAASRVPPTGTVVVDTPGYHMHVDVGVRWQQGTALELAYNDAFVLSELTWDIEDLFYAGIALQVGIGENWALHASYWEAISEGRGEMTDYDYFIPMVWTHFSDGPVDINRAYTLDLHAAWTFWQPEAFRFHLLGGYRQLYWDWSQYGGTFIYSDTGFRDRRGTFPADQNGINYEQTFHIPYMGIGMQTHWSGILFSGYMHYTPIARAEGFDEHVLRNLYFEDTFNNVNYYAAGVSLRYPMGTRWYLSGAWDWHDIPETRGDVRIIDARDRTEEKIENGAGIANRAWSLSLAGGMRF